MKNRTITVIAIVVGIPLSYAQMWSSSHIAWHIGHIVRPVLQHFGLLAVIVVAAMTFTLASPANAGEYTRGRAGMDRGDTSHLSADIIALNNSMRELSNNQQFLDGLLAYSQANANDGGQQMLGSLRDAVREYATGSDVLAPQYPGVGPTTQSASPLAPLGKDTGATSCGF